MHASCSRWGFRTSPRPKHRRGATLVDIATGSMLLAVILIPSAHLLTQSQSSHARLINRQAMIFEAENRLAETKIALSEPTAFNAAWSTSIDSSAPLPVASGPPLFSRTRVNADISLGATARLVTIVVDVWQDTNGNAQLDANEPHESIRTQWAAP